MAHRTQEELAATLANAASMVEVGGRYTHFKDPTKEYEVIGLGIQEADEGVSVIYKGLYGEGITFIRPLESWCATVEHEGKSTLRFLKVS
ncbi:MAG: DUF1653 domain-containing protein [Bacillota bacterium]